MASTALSPSLPSESLAAVPEKGKQNTFWQLLNISIGFLGIQFAWSIQMGQMSPLLESLGSDPRLTGLIWCAGPITGVLVQPLVGALSDRCTSRFGRRRPFLLLGALLTAITLIWMPNAPTLLIAAVLLWVLDGAINVTQGPYRAIVPDVVSKTRQASAYSLMSLTIGLGSVAAFAIGGLISNMHHLFYLGAVAMLLAMGWTIFTTPETPATSAQASAQETKAVYTSHGSQKGLTADSTVGSRAGNFLKETLASVIAMPREGLKLCIAHSFTWFGLMCLFVFFSLYVPHHIFGATNTGSALYKQGVQWGSWCFAVLNLVCFAFSACIGRLCERTSKKAVHTFGLLCMTLAMFGLFFITDKAWAMAAMGLMGIGWATTLSVPFALLSDHLPSGREGVMMGTFNIFIAAPGVLSTLLVGQIVSLYGNNVAVAMVVGGAAMLISALLLQGVHEGKHPVASDFAAAIEETPLPV